MVSPDDLGDDARVKRRARIALLFLLSVLLAPDDARAQRLRRRFEPTDLELRGRGTVELDVQTGVIQGASSRRVVAPDVEATLGLSANAQLQIDTALGFDDDHGGGLHFFENTWTALKLGIFDDGGATTKSVWAGGIQAGPKLPTTSWSRGLGVEALAIVGRASGPAHVFAQAGMLLDPYDVSPGAPRLRPFAVEGGFDLDLDLDTRDAWSIKAELGGARYFSHHTAEVHLTGGIAYRMVPWLELSAIAIAGLGPGDRFGALLGAAPRFAVF